MREGFSSSVKAELARLPLSKRCCQKSELGIMLSLPEAIKQSDGQLFLAFNNPSAYRRGFLLLKSLFASSAVKLKKEKDTQGRTVFLLVVKGLKMQELSELTGQVDGIIEAPRCCQRAFLRGAFLTSGSISDPYKQNHLELTSGWELATLVQEVLGRLGIVSRQFSRKGRPVIYLKDGEVIGEFLRLIGTHSSVLRFEQARVAKDVRNAINRVVNCETANVDKTVKAAMEQLQMIKTIDDYLGLVKLPTKLRAVAYKRINNPYASFQELAQSMDPPLSRSAISYRIRQLKKIAEGLSQSDEGF
jgi:DNA-binding protein WhiA